MIENEAGVGFINQPIRGEVTVFKTDKVTGDKLVGAGFRVFDADGNVVDESYTGEDGTVTFSLRYGEYKALLAMVTEINATQVDTQDKLTNQVYHYDVTDKVFEKASRYEDRKQEKDKSHEKKSVLEKLEEKKDEAKATIGAKKTSYREAVSL